MGTGKIKLSELRKLQTIQLVSFKKELKPYLPRLQIAKLSAGFLDGMLSAAIVLESAGVITIEVDQ